MRLHPRGPAYLALALLFASALALTGCGGVKRALGIQKVSPDEFQIVTKAPLVLPPDYSLKPPAQGEKVDEQDTQGAAQRALIGDPNPFTPTMSTGERALVASAGAQYADPLIRQVIDQEFAGLLDKSDDLTNRLVFWSANPAAAASAEVNPGAEAARIEAGKTGERASVDDKAPAKASSPNAAVPDQVEGQKPPVIGKEHSRLLDGIF